jgi:tRNA-binding protein
MYYLGRKVVPGANILFHKTVYIEPGYLLMSLMEQITLEDFLKVDIRTGTILSATPFEKARKPAYQLTIDFGADIGIRRSSAQLTHLYHPDALEGRQILAVVNFPPRQIANFFSEVLVLGLETASGVVLLQADRGVDNGLRVS